MSYIYVIKTDYPPELMKRIHDKQTESIAMIEDVTVTFDDMVEGLDLKIVVEGTNFS